MGNSLHNSDNLLYDYDVRLLFLHVLHQEKNIKADHQKVKLKNHEHRVVGLEEIRAKS